MLSLLVLFVIEFRCKYFTVESATIIAQGIFYAGCWNCLAQEFFYFQIYHYPDPEAIFLHY